MAREGKDLGYWEPHVRALQASGQTAVEYARANALSYHALGWWRRKLRGKAAAVGTRVRQSRAKPVGDRFVAVKVAAAPVPLPVTVSVGISVKVQFSALPDPDWLAAVERAASGVR